MSFIDKAVNHLIKQLEENNIATRAECEDSVRMLVKDGLVKLERSVFDKIVDEALDASSDKPKAADVGINDIVIYRHGAFGVQMFAPGGAMEVGDDGKALPEEPARFRKRWGKGTGPCRVCGSLNHHPLLCPDLPISCKCGQKTTQRYADEWCTPNPGESANMMCPKCNMSNPSSRIRRKLGELNWNE